MQLFFATPFVLLLFSLLATIEATNKRRIPTGLFKKSKQRGQTKNCKGRKGRQCDIDTSSIDIETADEIELDGVGSGNKKVKCKRRDFPGRAQTKGW